MSKTMKPTFKQAHARRIRIGGLFPSFLLALGLLLVAPPGVGQTGPVVGFDIGTLDYVSPGEVRVPITLQPGESAPADLNVVVNVTGPQAMLERFDVSGSFDTLKTNPDRIEMMIEIDKDTNSRSPFLRFAAPQQYHPGGIEGSPEGTLTVTLAIPATDAGYQRPADPDETVTVPDTRPVVKFMPATGTVSDDKTSIEYTLTRDQGSSDTAVQDRDKMYELTVPMRFIARGPESIDYIASTAPSVATFDAGMTDTTFTLPLTAAAATAVGLTVIVEIAPDSGRHRRTATESERVVTTAVALPQVEFNYPIGSFTPDTGVLTFGLGRTGSDSNPLPVQVIITGPTDNSCFVTPVTRDLTINSGDSGASAEVTLLNSCGRDSGQVITATITPNPSSFGIGTNATSTHTLSLPEYYFAAATGTLEPHAGQADFTLVGDGVLGSDQEVMVTVTTTNGFTLLISADDGDFVQTTQEVLADINGMLTDITGQAREVRVRGGREDGRMSRARVYFGDNRRTDQDSTVTATLTAVAGAYKLGTQTTSTVEVPAAEWTLGDLSAGRRPGGRRGGLHLRHHPEPGLQRAHRRQGDPRWPPGGAGPD